MRKKHVHQLSRKFNSRNARTIDKNVLNPDRLTLSMFIFTEQELNSLKRTLRFSNYQPEVSFANVNVNTTLNEFLSSQSGNLNDTFVAEINSAIDNAELDCNNKSLLSVLWAKVILNTLNKKEENNEALIDAFYAVIASSNEDATIDELHDEMIAVFNNNETISDYLSYAYNSIRDANNWLDYTSYPPSYVNDEMVYDLEIYNNEELVEALKDFKNLPSALEYIKNNFLNEKDARSEGFCKDELIRDYKALAVALRILADERYNLDPNFDKDNNIGLNLEAKLYATEALIKDEHVNYKNTEVFAGFKAQSRKIAIKALGNDNTNVYGVWRNVLNSYVKQCTNIARKVKSGEITVTTRNYLKTLGIIKERQPITNFNSILAQLKNKTDDARKVIEYLSEKKIDALSTDPFIDDAEQVFKELTDWATEVKKTDSRPLRLAHINADILTPKLKEFVSVAQRHAKTLIQKRFVAVQPKNTAVQISIYDDENENQ